jgi:membrane-associated phospholipid phosphatase
MREPGLFKPALLWLLLLAPLFFSTYGLATWVTSQRSDVGTLVFGWETHMPFWAWTIVPYWSIDLLYGFSLLLPNSRHELKQHALRLLSAQVIAVSCFLLWPLRFTFERPEMDGVFGWLFAVLAGFDKPFNQAPSLHIALLVILWVMYQRHSQGLWRWLVHGWFALIGISVLTTYQHHFIDLPTGALAGWLCVWLWPVDQPSPLLHARPAKDPKRWRLGLRYAMGRPGADNSGLYRGRCLAMAAVACRRGVAGGAQLLAAGRRRLSETRRWPPQPGSTLAVCALSRGGVAQLAAVDAQASAA